MAHPLPMDSSQRGAVCRARAGHVVRLSTAGGAGTRVRLLECAGQGSREKGLEVSSVPRKLLTKGSAVHAQGRTQYPHPGPMPNGGVPV